MVDERAKNYFSVLKFYNGAAPERKADVLAGFLVTASRTEPDDKLRQRLVALVERETKRLSVG